jgi:hypothetical protein
MSTKHLKLRLSSEHYTDPRMVEDARFILDGIDLDPASCAFANEWIRADTIYTKEDDGLAPGRPWCGNTFLNPPGSCGLEICKAKKNCSCGLPALFWRKAVTEWAYRSVPSLFWVGFAMNQLNHLQDSKHLPKGFPHPLQFPHCIGKKRMRFLDAYGDKGAAPIQGNYYCLLPSSDAQVDTFARVMRRWGHVTIPEALTRERCIFAAA